MRNHDYIKFVLSKVEKDFADYSGSPEYAKVITILHSLRSSTDILREIYILSGIKKLRELAGYLVFMFRKTQSGRVNLDNFLENYITDRDFIENYLQTYYNLEPALPGEYIEEEKEVFIFNEDANKDADKTVYSLAEPSFKVEEIDNELVSEEFKETKLLEQYDISESKYLELIQNDGNGFAAAPDRIEDDTEQGNDVFNLPSGTAQKKEEISEPEEPVFEEPAIKEPEQIEEIPAAEFENTEEELIPEPEEVTETKTEIKEQKKEEPHDLASFFEEVETAPAKETPETKEEISLPLFEEPVPEPPAEEFDNEEPEVISEEEPVNQPETLKEPTYEKRVDEKIIHEEEPVIPEEITKEETFPVVDGSRADA